MNAKNELYLRSYIIYILSCRVTISELPSNLLDPGTVSSPLSKNVYTAVNNQINMQNTGYCITIYYCRGNLITKDIGEQSFQTTIL